MSIEKLLEKTYDKLNENQLYEVIAYKRQHLNMPVHVANALIEKYTKMLRDKKAYKKRLSSNARFWRKLLAPLTYEISSVREGLKYHGEQGNIEFITAYKEYFNVLLAIKAEMEDSKSRGLSVANAIVRFEGKLAAENGRDIKLPNNGEHWVDWVNPKLKREITALIDGLPYKPKARKRAPFARSAGRPTASTKPTSVGLVNDWTDESGGESPPQPEGEPDDR